MAQLFWARSTEWLELTLLMRYSDTILCNEHLKLSFLIILKPSHHSSPFHHLRPLGLILLRIRKRNIHHKPPDLPLLQNNPTIHPTQPFDRKILSPFRSMSRY